MVLNIDGQVPSGLSIFCSFALIIKSIHSARFSCFSRLYESHCICKPTHELEPTDPSSGAYI